MSTSTHSTGPTIGESSCEYIHSPIQANEIRLFRGHLDKHDALIGEIGTFALDSPELPAFQAVSYTWGASAYAHSVNIGNKELPVLDSLYPFLRYVLGDDAQAPRAWWWWIDSLCINQKDSSEKALQVSMMGTIFLAAQQTIVWLGEERDGSAQAIQFLLWIDKEFGEDNKPSKEWLSKVVPRNGAHGKDWKAVEKLFGRPWWTRVWTVQEFVIPKRVILYCGESWISRTLLRRALLAIWQCREKTLKYDNPWNRTRLIEWHKRFGKDDDTKSLGSSLTATLAYLGYHEATDPRDRIYSLSGIVKDFELAGVPDYNQPVEVLYTSVVKSFVERYCSLDIICFATLFRSDEETIAHTLPSWVPDWRVRATAMVGPLMVSQSARGCIGNFRPLHSLHCTATYSAALSLESRADFSPDLREITCQGFFLDTIDGLAGLPFVASVTFPRERDELVHPTSHDSSYADDPHLTSRRASSIMESIMRCLTLDRADHYFNHSIPMYEFSQQFRRLLQMALASDLTLVLFRDWFNANRLLRICEWDLKTLAAKWLDNGEPIERSPQSGHRGSFYSRFHDALVKMSRRLVVTDSGFIGMAPRRARKSDLICVLFGCSVPVVLRKRADGETYTFIGECYVDGFMNGEAITMAKDMDKKSYKIV